MKDNDGKDLCIVSFGYTEIVLPMKAALMFFEAASTAQCLALESKWDNDTRSSFEVFAPIELKLRAMPEETYAVRKLQTHAWEEKERERKEKEKAT